LVLPTIPNRQNLGTMMTWTPSQRSAHGKGKVVPVLN